jgi:hypothetical protein
MTITRLRIHCRQAFLLSAVVTSAACTGGSTGPSNPSNTGGMTVVGGITSSGGMTVAGGTSAVAGIISSGGMSGVGGSIATNSSVPWTVAPGGYVTSGPWEGYAWTFAGGTGSTISPADFSTLAAVSPLCASGSVGPMADYSGAAGVGINLNQAQGANAPVENWTPTGAGIVINVSNPGGSALRVQIQGPTGATDATDRWCTTLTVFGQPVSFPWSAFNTACWNGSGSTYNMQPLSNVVLTVPGGNVTAVSFSACIASLSLQTGGGTGGTTSSTTTATGGTTSTGGSGTTTSAGGPSIEWGDSCEGNGAGTYWRKWGMTNVGGTGTVTVTTRVSGNATAGLAGEPDVSNQVDLIAGHEYSLIMQLPVSGLQGSCVTPLAACVFKPCIAPPCQPQASITVAGSAQYFDVKSEYSVASASGEPTMTLQDVTGLPLPGQGGGNVGPCGGVASGDGGISW